MGVVFVLVGILGVAISLVILIINAIKKKPKKKAVIALIVFIVLFIVGTIITPTPDNEPAQTEKATQTESPEQREEPVQTEEPDSKETSAPAVDNAIDAFIEQYNRITDIQILNPVEIDIQAPEYYRTEFRLNAYKNAIAKRCSIGEATIDIVNYGSLKNDEIRFYLRTDDKELAVQVFNTAVKIFDPSATEEEINEADEAILDEKNGNYLNDIEFYYISSYHELFVNYSNIDFFTNN